MDVNTGKILAMASIGGYDLNNFLDVSDEAQSAIDGAVTKEEKEQLLADAQRLQWRNKTLSDTYEPGSTFKIITLSMALEEGAVPIDDPRLASAEKVALFFGCEGYGLARATLDAVGRSVIIPMSNGVDSLNVAASSAVAFWELFARGR